MSTRPPSSPTPALAALCFLAFIGLLAGVALMIAGKTTGEIATLESPLTIVALGVVARQLDHVRDGQSEIKRKVNGQLDQERTLAYGDGYRDGLAGRPPNPRGPHTPVKSLAELAPKEKP
jgi:hypothetical protein